MTSSSKNAIAVSLWCAKCVFFNKSERAFGGSKDILYAKKIMLCNKKEKKSTHSNIGT